MPERDEWPELIDAAGAVVDPVLFHRLGELGTVALSDSSDEQVTVVVEVTSQEYPEGDELHRRVVSALAPLVGNGVRLVVELEAMDEERQAAIGLKLNELDGVESTSPLDPSSPASGQVQPGAVRSSPIASPRSRTRVLAIASGKGGVGKSTVAVNLAVALVNAGHSVGLLDADITGFSVPAMLSPTYPPIVLGRTVVPPVACGVRVMSTGFFASEDKPIAWRGPMLHKALEQFLVEVHWGSPDFLVVDMPPGTGDVALSVAQQLPRAEVYVVTTPQPAAQRVAQRAGALGRQVKLPLRGVIENMSWFVAPDGVRHELFGSGGGAALAEALGVPLLAQVPLETAVRAGADDGRPAVIADPDGEVTKAFATLAARIVELGPSRVYRSELKIS